MTRYLASLIYNSGQHSRSFVRKIPDAYAFYRDKNDAEHPNGGEAKNVRQQYGDRVPIKALCCWDVVASVGLPDLTPGADVAVKFDGRYSIYDYKVNRTL
jgi:hypothetical protein